MNRQRTKTKATSQQQKEKGECGLSPQTDLRFFAVFQDFTGREMANESNAILVMNRLVKEDRHPPIFKNGIDPSIGRNGLMV
jgi:hypothetical protein